MGSQITAHLLVGNSTLILQQNQTFIRITKIPFQCSCFGSPRFLRKTLDRVDSPTKDATKRDKACNKKQIQETINK